jgi:L-2-haloalkanoic acid dehalogenase
LEPLTEEVDYTITTIEELLKILPDNFETEGEEQHGNGFNY